ncbi:MAG: hypothetical protein LBJ09_02255 [Clostridiales bacterium]|jgi:hypothetical protein|nr:hypothetical protein [Clostridiales bacterium]
MLQKHLRYAGSTPMRIESVRLFEEEIEKEIALSDSVIRECERIFPRLDKAQFDNLNSEDFFKHVLSDEINNYFLFISLGVQWLKKLLDESSNWRNIRLMSDFLLFFLTEFRSNFVRGENLDVVIKKMFLSEINFRKLFNDNNFGFIFLALSHHYYETLKILYDNLKVKFNSLNSICNDYEMSKFITLGNTLSFFENLYTGIFSEIYEFIPMPLQIKLTIQKNFSILLKELSKFVSQESRFLIFRLQYPSNPIVQLMNANENLDREKVKLILLDEFFSLSAIISEVFEAKRQYIEEMGEKVEEIIIQTNGKEAQLHILYSYVREISQEQAIEEYQSICSESVIDFEPIPMLPKFRFSKTKGGIPVFTDEDFNFTRAFRVL